jgi:acetyltransferase-like isoleucine patch superfamily enzyme
MNLMTFFRGLRVLRYPEVVRRLGDLRAVELDLEELRRRNPGASISSDAIIDSWRGGTLQLAPGSQIERGTMLNLGDAHNGYGTLIVGERTWIGQYNNLRLAGGATIRIGAGCLIAQFCTIVAANHTIARDVKIAEAPPAMAPRDVTIGDDVWLGAGAIILPGVTIADGAVIGAGSVVTRSIAAYEIWAGNPATKIGERK